MSVYGTKTKKDLKAKVGFRASDVLMETSLYGPEIVENGKLCVVGPGPYERKWYAEITIKDGLIVKVT